MIVIAAVGAADDIRPIGVAPRFFLQALSVALVIFALPGELRVALSMPVFIERLLLTIGLLWFVNLVNFMDGLDWMTVAEVVPITAALAIFGAFGFCPQRRRSSASLLRRHDRVCIFQPASRQAFPRRCRQPADRPVARLADGGTRRSRCARRRDPVAALYLADLTITLVRRLINGEKVWKRTARIFISARPTAASPWVRWWYVFLRSMSRLPC